MCWRIMLQYTYELEGYGVRRFECEGLHQLQSFVTDEDLHG